MFDTNNNLAYKLKSSKLKGNKKLRYLLILAFPSLAGIFLSFSGIFNVSFADFSWMIYGFLLFSLFLLFVYVGMQAGFYKQKSNIAIKLNKKRFEKRFPIVILLLISVFIVNILYLNCLIESNYFYFLFFSNRIGDLYTNNLISQAFTSGSCKVINLGTTITLPLSYLILAWLVYYNEFLSTKKQAFLLLMCFTSSLLTLASLGRQGFFNFFIVLIIAWWIKADYNFKKIPNIKLIFLLTSCALFLIFTISYLRSNVTDLSSSDTRQNLDLMFEKLSPFYQSLLIKSNYSPILFTFLNVATYLSNSWIDLPKILEVNMPNFLFVSQMRFLRIIPDGLFYGDSNYTLAQSVQTIKSAKLNQGFVVDNAWATTLSSFKIEYGDLGLVIACIVYGFLCGYWFSRARFSYWNFILGILSIHFVAFFWMFNSMYLSYFEVYLYVGLLGSFLFSRTKRKPQVSTQNRY